MTKDEIRANWDKRRAPKALQWLVNRCLTQDEWEQIGFIIRASPCGAKKAPTEEDGRRFLNIRASGLKGSMNWPYIALNTRADVAVAWLVIGTDMGLWDFRTGKKLAKGI